MKYSYIKLEKAHYDDMSFIIHHYIIESYSWKNLIVKIKK